MGNFDDFSRVRNSYFNTETSAYDLESQLYDVLLNEAFNKHGVEMYYYIVSYNTEFNRTWGEDNNRSIARKFRFMSYYELPREDESFSQFGIEDLDVFKIFISKRHFMCASKYTEEEEYTPKIGDIVRPTYSNKYYEVISVEQEEEMFHQRKHAWELILKIMRDEHIKVD
jgi:hypothetical protein